MIKHPALALPTWRHSVSGLMLAVVALAFLCSVTQSTAFSNAPGKINVNHLEHLVVASHHSPLTVETTQAAGNTLNDSPDPLNLAVASRWPHTSSQPPAVGGDTPAHISLPDYLHPPLRAPPIA